MYKLNSLILVQLVITSIPNHSCLCTQTNESIQTFFNSRFLASFPVNVKNTIKVKWVKLSIATDVNEKRHKIEEGGKIIMNEWDKVLLAWSVGFINFPLFVVDIDRLPILILLCLPQELQQNQRENVQSTKTSWRPPSAEQPGRESSLAFRDKKLRSG